MMKLSTSVERFRSPAPVDEAEVAATALEHLQKARFDELVAIRTDPSR